MTGGGSSLPEVQALLRVLAAGRDVAELGTAFGEGAAAMAETARSVVTVERDPERARLARARLADLANVELLEGDWREAFARRGPFDLVFADGGTYDWEAILELVKPGALITAQQTLLATLYSSDPMWVNFSISEDRFLELQRTLKHPPGDRPDTAPPFHIRLADGTDYSLAGKLNFIDATIDQKSGTLQVRISVPNPDRLLRPGLFVRVIVAAFENPNAIRIPQQAVQELQGLKTVYVVGAEDKAEARQIVAKYRIGNDWVVDSGLNAGDRIVIEGVSKVRAGAPVKPVVAAAVTRNAAADPAPAAAKK